MKAGLRFGVLMVVAGMLLGAPALAQDSTQSTTNTPATDAIGPRELQGFSLPGTVTRAADQPPARQAPQSQRPEPTPRTTTASSQDRNPTPPASRSQPVREAAATVVSRATTPEPARSDARPLPSLSSVTTKLPPATSVASASTEPEAFPDDAQAAPLVAPEGGFPVWPWLLAALVLGAGGAFLFWRKRERHSYAGGPHVDAFSGPEPEPRRPIPAPRAAPKPPQASNGGVVTTRLRPWIDLGFQAVKCIVEDDRVLIEFELELFNSGSAPARDLLIEAVMMNASPLQDEEAKGFFGRTSGEGGRMPSIGPMKRVHLRRQVGLAKDQIRILDAGGRKVFVPLIAFNVIYNRSGGIGQTSAVYLVGRDNEGEKLAPFRIDLGRRVFRKVAARVLPTAVRN